MCPPAKRAVHNHLERNGNNMISGYEFGKTEIQDCFEDGTVNTLYSPVMDSVDFPKGIRDKTEAIIENMIYNYETENNCNLDLSAMCINAKLDVFMNKTGKWSYEIAVVISGKSGCDDVWIEEDYSIKPEDHLYEIFRRYFMEQLESNLFNGYRVDVRKCVRYNVTEGR